MRHIKCGGFGKKLSKQQSITETLQMISKDIRKGAGKEMWSEEH